MIGGMNNTNIRAGLNGARRLTHQYKQVLSSCLELWQVTDLLVTQYVSAASVQHGHFQRKYRDAQPGESIGNGKNRFMALYAGRLTVVRAYRDRRPLPACYGLGARI